MKPKYTPQEELEWGKKWRNTRWNIFIREWARFLRKHKTLKATCNICSMEEGDEEVFEVNCKKCLRKHHMCNDCFLKGCKQ